MKVLYLSLKISLVVSAILMSVSLQAQSKTHVQEEVVKIKSRSDKGVNVIWPAYQGDVSQYILERSVDGKRYQEVSAFVAVMSNEEPYYEFNDRFKLAYTGPLFYRVRIEGLDGQMIYTPVTILKAMDLAAK